MYRSLIAKVEAILSAKVLGNMVVDNSITYIADYSTEISYVFKFSIQAGSSVKTIFTKMDKYNSGLVLEEYNNLCNVKKLNLTSRQFRVPEIALFDEENGILGSEECKGLLFLELINNHCKWRSSGQLENIPSFATSVGSWLSYYEKNTQKKSSSNFKETLIDEFNLYTQHLTNMFTDKSISRLFLKCKDRFFEELKELEYPANTYLSHGDFHPGNFFIEGQDVTAIDFQQSKRRLNGYDAIYFEMNSLLSFGPLNYRPKYMALIQSSFSAGYNSSIEYEKLLKPLVIARALVYLNTIGFSKGNFFSYLSVNIDIRKLTYWLNK